MHKAQAILNAIKSSVTPLVTGGVIELVLSNTAELPEQHPAIIIRMGEDDVVSRNMSNARDHDLNVYVDIYVHSKNTDLDEQVLAIREEAEKAILADEQLGLPFVLYIEFNGASNPEYSGDAELYSASVRLNFTVKYRVNKNNPSL